ncbi:MAG: Orotate phosphoribosyltransferase [bacterium]|nr:Orotate phosphoribosyltransferase [bacterium]
MPTPWNTQMESPLRAEEAQTLLGFLQSSEALLSGHFRLTSGLHSPNYLQCARLLMDPVRAEWCGQWLGKLVAEIQARWVLSPALGGLIIGHELARALGVPHLFAERKEGIMSIRRGFRVPPGEPFIAVEDVVTTGGSVQEAARVAQEQGGVLAGVCSIFNRSGKGNPFGEEVPYFSLLRMDFPTYGEAECPLCKSGLAIDTPGSRKN